MELNLKGQSVLITGSSKGIGLAIAEKLAVEGCESIHLTGRDEARLSDAKERLQSLADVSVNTHGVDLGTPEGRASIAEVCASVDILVNNAGAIPAGSILDVDEDTWRTGWELKVFGYINLTRTAYSAMAARGSGVILNIVGNAGERPDAHYVAVGSANAALIYFTEAIGGRSMEDGVRVLGINPGPVSTDRYIEAAKIRAQRELGDAERYAGIFAKLPMRRPAHPEEVADLAAFLVSERAAYISGEMVRIDGGLNSRPPG